MATVYFSLGANIGDREAHLREALRRLEAPWLHLTRQSSIYETAPRDFEDQPWFLNLAAEADVTLEPRALLEEILALEQYFGRRRDVSKGPRAIDIDILFYGGCVIDEPGLHVPHPRLHERRFVLEPLAELAPGLVHPVLGKSVADLLAATLDQDVRRWKPA
jgi:2-amino-4-hydroxy-6-hydroxymethyldihydropteridine diphosphokinase